MTNLDQTREACDDLPDYIRPGKKVAVYHGRQVWSVAEIARLTATQVVVSQTLPSGRTTEWRHRRDNLAQVGNRYGGAELRPLDDPARMLALRGDQVARMLYEAESLATQWRQGGSGHRLSFEGMLGYVQRLEGIVAEARAKLSKPLPEE